jgi:hypothetical protein
LARCEGFEVCSEDARISGVVARVELDRTRRASALVVEQRRGALFRLDSAGITFVDPWRRLVVFASPSRVPRAARARAASALALRPVVRGSRATLTGTAKAGAALAAGGAAARRAAPPSRRFAVWAAARAAYALAFAGWLYGATLYVLSRVAARVLLVVLSGLTRLGIRVTPPIARATRTVTGWRPSKSRRPGHWIPRRH